MPPQESQLIGRWLQDRSHAGRFVLQMKQDLDFYIYKKDLLSRRSNIFYPFIDILNQYQSMANQIWHYKDLYMYEIETVKRGGQFILPQPRSIHVADLPSRY